MPPTVNYPRPLTFISADWASNKSRNKRSVHVAVLRHDGRVCVERVTPPTTGRTAHKWNLKGLLRLGDEWARSGASVIIGVDVALGVPVAYLKRRKAQTFLEWLGSAPGALGKETESSTRCYTGPVPWSVDDPFFNLTSNPKPARRDSGVFVELRRRVGDELLYRRFDQKTGAQPLWALNKGGSVGSGTRDFWRDLVEELGERKPSFRVWPFEPPGVSPVDSRRITLAETYPALAYSVALASALHDRPPRLVQIGKTVTDRRRRVCERVKGMSWFERTSWEHRGKLDEAFDGAFRNEDHFDSLLTALAVVRCALERPEGLYDEKAVDRTAEGGMLLAGAVESSSARSYENWLKEYGDSCPSEA